MPRQFRSNPNTKHKAIKLRKASTPAQVKLWSRIRNDQFDVSFRRQHAIGNYIVDFSPEGDDVRSRKKLIIELDGSPHLEQAEYDEERTGYREARGYRVLRFWNHDVINHMDDVLRVIWSVRKDEKSDETKRPPDSAGSDWSSLAFNTLVVERRE